MRVALSTGGGDAPGINAVIRAATLGARRRGWEVVGIRDGFNGLMFPEQYPQGNGTVVFERHMVRGIGYLGGTVLGSTNRGNPCHFPVEQPDGSFVYEDRTEHLVSLFREAGIDALITIGGDGSLTIGQRLCQAGLRVIGVPKTIDNDLDKTDVTFGFDTAVFSRHRVDRSRVHHGDVAQQGVRGRGDGPVRRVDRAQLRRCGRRSRDLDPEIPFRLEPVAEMINRRQARGASFAIVVVAEGAMPKGGERRCSVRHGIRPNGWAGSANRWLDNSPTSPARRPEPRCSGTCCEVVCRPLRIACSAPDSARQRFAPSTKVSTA